VRRPPKGGTTGELVRGKARSSGFSRSDLKVNSQVPTPPEGGTTYAQVWDVAKDDSWHWSTTTTDGWEEGDFKDGGPWMPTVERGGVNRSPWKLEKKFAQALSAASLAGHVRASLVAADPLTTALGRPNREQVLTLRSPNATTLQALELTNGKTLAEE